MLYLCSVLLLSIAYLVYHYFIKCYNYWKDRNVVGPEPVLFFGNLKESTLRRAHIATVMKNIYAEFPNEKVIGIYRMKTPCLLLRDLDVIKHIMIKDFELFVDRGVEFSKDGLGSNLFHSDGDIWKALRNRFSPIFTTSKLKNMIHLVIDRADKFVEYVRELSDGQQEHEVQVLMQQYTIAVIATCGFGLDVDKFSDETKKLLRKMDSLIFDLNYAHEFDMMFPGFLRKLNLSLFPEETSNFFYDLVRTVISQRDGKPTGRKDFMDLILELRQLVDLQQSQKCETFERNIVELTEGVIAAQAFSFYAAGYETSASVLAFLLYHLALNPTIQDKLIQEIDTVLVKNDGQITYDIICEMPYLDKVLREALRMYPVAEPIQRKAKSDYKVPGTDVTIKKGQTVIISLLGIHYDEKLYPNPDKFDPERYNTEHVGERHICAYMPFGIGPRNCVGLRFAKVQTRVGIIKFFSNFRVEPSTNTSKKIEIDPRRFLLSPKGGIYLNIVQRKK